MSIFNLHKNGAPPRQTETPAPDAATAERFAEAVAQADWHQAWRYYQQGGQALLGNGDAVLPLAQYLSDENRPDDALALLQGFSARYPDHRDVVKNYLLAVHIMRRDFADHAGARTLLERLAQTYPGHPDYPLIAQQLENQP